MTSIRKYSDMLIDCKRNHDMINKAAGYVIIPDVEALLNKVIEISIEYRLLKELPSVDGDRMFEVDDAYGDDVLDQMATISNKPGAKFKIDLGPRISKPN